MSRNSTANASQRARRRRNVRMDYYPQPAALAVFQRKKAEYRPNSVAGTNSAVLDVIVREWAELKGWATTPETGTGISPRHNAHARMTSVGPPSGLFRADPKPCPAACGAKTRAGHPCRGRALEGTGRCKWHGGKSTGPKTAEGRARALANLKQYRARPE